MMNTGTELARTAERTAELAVASARTIGYRTAMMAQAAGNPVLLADPEFVLMWQEKVEAGIAATLAVGESLRPMYEAWLTWAGHQSHGNLRAAGALGTSRTPQQMIQSWSIWLEESLTGAAAAAEKLAEASGKVAAAGLAPIHAAASANARRLSARRN
ncbi:phasin family protein [Arenibaculum pallidiluteum]|uniref:phasin family protein n=1 Tax=Arenibaculum pallidiluteum TaxID=2812559 RepID=UPI001A96A50E|nr:phasin family protein [Arenibaculum pallidiluteum]